MTEEQSFFNDVINLMPYKSVCYIQCPSLENESILAQLKDTELPYFKSLELNIDTKRVLLKEIAKSDVQDDIQWIQIKLDSKLLFEGFDGVEYGIVSESILLPDNFIQEHIKGGVCTVAKGW